MPNACRVVMVSVALVALCGCGTKRLHPVGGKVAFADGNPLPGGMVVFYPTDPKRQELSRGSIAANGSIVMGTESPSDGVPVGTYRIAVLPSAGELPPPSRGSRGKAAVGGKELVHPRFFNPQTSGLEFTVQAGENHLQIGVSKP